MFRLRELRCSVSGNGAVLRTLGLALAVAAQWCVMNPAAAQEAKFDESQIKAVFLYNFASFITWPQSAFESARSPIRYCALDDGAVTDNLEKTLKGESVNGRALELFRPTFSEIKVCHVLFIPASRRNRLAEILRAVEGLPILTVSDSDGFAAKGGMIGLVREAGRIRPAIGTGVLARAGLAASSKLLRLATLVGSAGREDTR